MTTVQLDEATEKRLALLAKKTGRTKSYHLRKALEERPGESRTTLYLRRNGT